MAAIKYTSIINAWVSTEGSDGFMTNYVYYSVLVAYEDGNREIINGQLQSIQYLLKYVRTPMDELMELKESIKGLRNDMNEVIDQKTTYILDSLYPIPDMLDKNEDEAKKMLTKTGLTPVLINEYPSSTPHNGIVRSYSRSQDDFKSVELNIIHEIPQMVGKTESAALLELKDAGFNVSVVRTMTTVRKNKTVISCERESETSLDLTLEVATQVPDTAGMDVETAVKELEKGGFTVKVNKVFDSKYQRNTVMKWVSTGETEVELTASAGPSRIKAKEVNVTFNSLQGSTGDQYSAEISYDGVRKELEIECKFRINCKAKHTITKLSAAAGENLNGTFTGSSMNPGEEGRTRITIPYEIPAGDVPADTFKFVIETQYGMLKKETEIVNLEFKVKWE